MKTQDGNLLRENSLPMQRTLNLYCQMAKTIQIIKIFFIIMLFQTLFSCSKNEHPVEEYTPVQISCTLTKDFDSCKLLIDGDWDWLEEKRFNRVKGVYEYFTPQNQGYTSSVSFKNDTAYTFKNGVLEVVRTYKIVRLTEISGTNFPEDNDPVIVFYNLSDGLRNSHVPIKICKDYVVFQIQFVRSIGEDKIWKRQ